MTASVRLRPLTADELVAWAAHSRDGFVEQQVASGLSSPEDARADAKRIFAEQVPDGLDTPGQHFWRVEADGQAVGHVWLRVRERAEEVEAFLFDIDLEPASRGRGLGRATMVAVHQRAAELGATVVRLNVFGHNTAALSLYDSLGYAVAAAQMHRRLDAPVAPSHGPVVALRDMTPAEYAVFRPHLEEDYGANIASSGSMSLPDALAKAVADLDRLLPEGLATPGHRLWTAYDGSEAVGVVWVALQQRTDGLHAFGYDLEVPAPLRRRGYGRAVVEAAFRSCRELGVSTVGLSVFGFNEGARRLYDELGFTLTAQTMVLALPA